MRHHVLAFALVLAATRLAVGGPSSPNLVIILVDDLGYGDVGCYGSQGNKTPNIDRLAADGLRCTDFHSNGPMCSPTRAALLTGCYQQRFGKRFDSALSPGATRDPGLPLEAVTLAEMLKEAGYATAMFGKWHLGYKPPLMPASQGFDEFRGLVSGDGDHHTHIDRSGGRDWWNNNDIRMERGYTADLLTDYSVDFIQRHNDRPFFLYVAHLAIHFPWQGPDDPPHRVEGTDYANDKWGIVPDRKNVASHVRAMVESVDQSVGRIIAALRQHGLTENTLVVFASDNGGYLDYPAGGFENISSNGPLKGQKGSVDEGGHRVPGIFYWPGRIKGGQVTDETVLTMDLYPTFAQLAGATLPSQQKLDGIDLATLLFQNQRLPRRALCWRRGNACAVRHGPWKLNLSNRKRLQLYNLQRDLGETTNVAAEHPDLANSLMSTYDAWERDVNRGYRTHTKRPNIVLFFTDDQAYDTLGCYGNPDVITPNMDQLASHGVVFDRHYDTTAICMASRASVMTGMYEYKTGCNFMHGPLARDKWQKSYPVLLRQAGYRTAFGGKFGFAVVDDPRHGGSENQYRNLPLGDFDFWVGGIGQTSYVTRNNKYLAKYADEYPHSTRAYGAAGQDFIRQSVASGKPFCLSLFFKAPHRPTTPDPVFDDIYSDSVFRKLPNYGRHAGRHLASQSRMGRQYPRFVEWGYHREESYQKALRTYHQQIYGVDFAIGMVMSELDRQGVSDDTVIIVSSDNGFFNGSHGLGSKALPYEEGARVPLIICDPRSPTSGTDRRSRAVTGNVDISATIVDLAGLERPDNMDGRSLMPIVNGTRSRIRNVLPVIQVWGAAGTLALSVVTETHKFIYWVYGEGVEPTEELFDLADDPFELKNLAGDPQHRSVLTAMRQLYDKEVMRWKEHAVPYNDYQQFGTLLDREIPWSDKKQRLPKQFRSTIKRTHGPRLVAP